VPIIGAFSVEIYKYSIFLNKIYVQIRVVASYGI
jgi:hypothetical protein